jgi:nitrate reductase gamma subunit
MYEFVTGPLAWLAFGIFFIGLLYRLVWYIRGLNWQMDRVTYSVNVAYGIRGALRSIFFWLVPFGTRSWRFYPGFTVLVFVFHICLLATPYFSWAITCCCWNAGDSACPPCPKAWPMMTLAVIVAAVFIILRRIALPEVRILTKPYDFLVLAIAVAPFLTGFLAYHQVGSYDFWIVAHVLSGEIMLVAIPFTKLSHFLLFFLSRAQLGMDYGIKRGGMKNKGMAW